jgi:hypothetical protein
MKLHRTSLLALLLAAPLAFAQTSSQVQAQPQPPSDAATPPPAVIVLPERVIETTVDLSTGGPQSGQSAYDARKEAIGALAEAKTACRHEGSRAAQSDCLRNAQEEYNAVMARTSGKHR